MNGLILPDAPWRNTAGLQAVVAALPDSRLVGGAVRDGLLRLPVSDIDLATTLLPGEVISRLEAAGIKAVPTGIDHGTITAVAHGQVVEVTTLRRDVSTDGRRATVAFSTDWQDDAARRDFTINALYADPLTGAVIDYHGGISDLEGGLVRFIGDPAARIAEDHLRILRFFRFHARFGKGLPDAAALAAIATAANSLMALSRERIADELIKLLALADPLASIELMIVHGVFAPFLPELVGDATAGLARLLQRERATGQKPSSVRRLSALLPGDAAKVEAVAARLKLSNKLRGELVALATPMSATPRALAYRIGTAAAIDQLLRHGEDRRWAEDLAAISAWQTPELPIKGRDLIARGLTAGPLVAQTLQLIEQSWIDEDFPNAARAQQIADQAVSEALLATRNS